MTAMVRVDGTAYRLLGPPCTPNVSALPLQGLPEIHPTRTVYQFAIASVRVNMTFASPKFMEDLHALSLPLSLIYFDVAAIDGASRPVVQLFFETSAQMIVDDDAQPVVWQRDGWASDTTSASMSVGTAEQAILRQRDLYIDPGQPSQHLDWGYLHLTVPTAAAQRAVRSQAIYRCFRSMGLFGQIACDLRPRGWAAPTSHGVTLRETAPYQRPTTGGCRSPSAARAGSSRCEFRLVSHLTCSKGFQGRFKGF
jgi:hypothetical protein